jgi:predicted nucleotidyltransferase
MELAVFGSWAARYRGERGPVPGDVDLLVVGTVTGPPSTTRPTGRHGGCTGR